MVNVDDSDSGSRTDEFRSMTSEARRLGIAMLEKASQLQQGDSFDPDKASAYAARAMKVAEWAMSLKETYEAELSDAHITEIEGRLEDIVRKKIMDEQAQGQKC